MEKERRNIPAEMEEEEIDLGLLLITLWRSFRRFWWLVLLLAALGAAGFYGFQRFRYTPMYRSSATFTVTTEEGGSGTYSFYYDSTMADQMSRTFPYILDSSFFRSLLLERLGRDSLNGSITAETIEESNVVTMTAESRSPEDTYAILQGALEIYPEAARFVLGEISFNYLDPAEMPEAPYNQISLKRGLVLGGCGGLLVSLVILGLISLARKTARNPEEMQKITSLRCLASIPHVTFKARKKQGQSSLAVWEKRVQGGYKESIRALGIRVEKELKKLEGKILLVTSTVSGEGKSTLAMNLAAVLGEQGKKVLLVDGDLRKAADAGLLGAEKGSSLLDLTGEVQKTIEIRKAGRGPFWLLGNGETLQQPAPVLSSPWVGKFLKKMRQKMDYIILDTPPAGMFQDAAILAEEADGILYAVKYDYVPQQRILEGFSSLGGSGAPILGYVFNDYPEASSEYGYGRYGYGRYGYGYRKYGYEKYGEKAGEDRA